jgi:hypothetical protein
MARTVRESIHYAVAELSPGLDLKEFDDSNSGSWLQSEYESDKVATPKSVIWGALSPDGPAAVERILDDVVLDGLYPTHQYSHLG